MTKPCEIPQVIKAVNAVQFDVDEQDLRLGQIGFNTLEKTFTFNGIFLTYNANNQLSKAGAINHQSAALLGTQILNLKTTLAELPHIDTVILLINSAGADFETPNEALAEIEHFLSELIKIKQYYLTQVSQWLAVVPQYVYGGMAISVCSCFDLIILAPGARLGVLGSRSA